jgi:hypothetical protein
MAARELSHISWLPSKILHNVGVFGRYLAMPEPAARLNVERDHEVSGVAKPWVG